MPYSSSVLVSHPHQSLEKHITAVDRISRSALASKYIAAHLAQPQQLEMWRLLLVYFHDFGKSTIYFQHKIIQAALKENPSLDGLEKSYIESFYQENPKYNIEQELADDNSLGSHAALGAYAVQGELANEELLTRAILLEIIKRHHGDLKNFDEEEFFVLDGFKDMSLLKQWEKSNHEDYSKILTAVNLYLPEELSSILTKMNGSKLLMGLSFTNVLPASDIKPYTLTLFLFSLLLAADKGDLMVEKKEQVAATFRFPDTLVGGYKYATFGSVSPKGINANREMAYQLVEQNLLQHTDSPFYSITLPTGLGKTFTAFNAAIKLQNALAQQYAQTGSTATPRIIYCLPFTSVIDQNAGILEEILAASNLNEGYVARHHYLADWPGKKEGSEEELTDSEKEYFTEGWEYSFTVTTFVQFLETIFSNKNRKLRKFHNLANAIVILDEVQNIPPKYFETVEAMFQMLFECFNTRFIFVTATQPFLITQSPVTELTDPTLKQTEAFFSNMNRIDLDLALWEEGEQPLDELLLRFQQAIEAERDKSFLFIFSKVKSSQTAFRELTAQNPDAKMVYLSAAILPILRKERIELIKKPPKGKQLIVVTTQVVEAGVDIDLDIVYRDFAPLDSINQSAGRCNRNGLKGRGQVRLFRSEKGTTNVYDSVLIRITEKVLRQQLANQEGLVIPESAFYDMNNTYAKAIRTAIAHGNNASEMIVWMKALQFEKVSNHFKLIDMQKNRHSVFIDYCAESHLVWKDYCQIAKIADRWERKKEMRKLRPRLLMYVVQFPDNCLPSEKTDAEAAIIYLGQTEYPEYYSLETGYGVYQRPPFPTNYATSI